MKGLNLNKEYERVKKTEGEAEYDPPIPISRILNEIKDGKWVIPEFQRDFVWGIDKFVLLFDSIYRGYTIGNLLLWKTNEKLAYKKIGEKDTVSIENIVYEEQHTYILDGQQRLTTLFAVLTGKKLYKYGRKKARAYKIFFDIEKDEFISELQKLKEFGERPIKDLIKEEKFDKFRFIDLSQIFDSNIRFPENLVKEEDNILREKLSNKSITADKYTKQRDELDIKKEPLEKFAEIIKAYKIHQIVERGNDLDKVVTVFERINTQNVKLDIYDIMVAKTYENINFNMKTYTFNLGRTIKKILYKNEIDKEDLVPDYKLPEDENLYYNIDNTTILRLISIYLNVKNKIALQKRDIYRIKAQEIQDNIESIRQMLEQVARYFKNQINLKSLDVNYTDNKILSFLSYIFSEEKYATINPEIINKWFWNTLLLNRYPGAQLQRIETDLKKYGIEEKESLFLEQVKNDRSLNILNKDYSINDNFLINAGYHKQNYLYRAIILLLNSLRPKDFTGKDEINLTDYVGSNTKNNKHHIIPYNSNAADSLRKKYEKEKANFMLDNIANISIISTELNKHISGKDPKDYFKEYEKLPDFNEILTKHLITKDMYRDLLNENYENFLKKRTQKIIDFIIERCKVGNEKLNLQEERAENGN